jgi:phosphohistidine phosphatase
VVKLTPASSELYLVRHGVAADRGPEYPDDSVRPLTTEGMARLRRQAAGLDVIGVKLDVILTSPLVRARQTADLLAARLLRKGDVVVTPSLAPSAPASALTDELGRLHGRKRIALVGHEPDLGELAARLLGTQAPVPFKKGGVCRIDFNGARSKGAGTLVWMLTPKMLRLLGRSSNSS